MDYQAFYPKGQQLTAAIQRAQGDIIQGTAAWAKANKHTSIWRGYRVTDAPTWSQLKKKEKKKITAEQSHFEPTEFLENSDMGRGKSPIFI